MGQRLVEVAIIGCGFSGLASAIELKKAGIEDFVILERGTAVGGTWRDNSYPGCSCDVPSHLYSLSAAPKSDWTRAYAPQQEILTYLEEVADRHALRPHIQLSSGVESLRWDEVELAWTIALSGGRTLIARSVISAVGAFGTPAYPTLPGLDRFEGHTIHSARWDHDYDFSGKRVAVIGTGASAIQFIPQLQKKVAHLDVVQRTPAWVLPKPDRRFSAARKAAFERVPALRWLYRQSIYLRNEATFVAMFDHPKAMQLAAWIGRRHIERYIKDPALRDLLTPSYVPGCKRILISNDYYRASASRTLAPVTATFGWARAR